MKKSYTSAMGKPVDLDSIMARNETTIAVGNYRVNARGDELGPGGVIVRTRDQVMKDYYALKTPTVGEDPLTQAMIEKHNAAQTQAVEQSFTMPEVTPPEPIDIIAPPENSGIDEVDMDTPAPVVTPTRKTRK